MTKQRSLVARGTTLVDESRYVSFAEVVHAQIGGDLGQACKHIDGIGARNLTSDPEISRNAVRFLGDYTDPDGILIHEDDIGECVRRFKKHQRQGD